MNIFFLKLAVAVIPLVALVATVNIFVSVSKWYAHRPLAWHRSRRHILHALAHGIVLR